MLIFILCLFIYGNRINKFSFQILIFDIHFWYESSTCFKFKQNFNCLIILNKKVPGNTVVVTNNGAYIARFWVSWDDMEGSHRVGSGKKQLFCE